MTLVIHSARLVDDGTDTADAWVRFDGGRVDAVGTGDDWRTAGVEVAVDATAVAGPGALLSPGFIDIHGHGGAGASYDDGVEAIRTARALHRRHGTTSAVLSLVSAPLPLLASRAAAIADLVGTDGILGSHLEGPFLSNGHRGAHDPLTLGAPAPDAVAALLDAGGGTVRQVTLAPELDGAFAAIAAVLASGAVAAVGHTGADRNLAARAFDAGATVLTHAFNAMPGLHHREPGPAGAALTDHRVTLEVIADGVHLHPAIVRLAFDAARGRVALITDAMAAAGGADGRYSLGGMEVDVTGGVARLATGNGSIAGSTLTQDAAVRAAVDAGVDVVDVLRAVTATPARAIGAPEIGSLRPGSRADAVLLSPDLAVAGVWADGAPVDR